MVKTKASHKFFILAWILCFVCKSTGKLKIYISKSNFATNINYWPTKYLYSRSVFSIDDWVVHFRFFVSFAHWPLIGYSKTICSRLIRNSIKTLGLFHDHLNCNRSDMYTTFSRQHHGKQPADTLFSCGEKRRPEIRLCPQATREVVDVVFSLEAHSIMINKTNWKKSQTPWRGFTFDLDCLPS